MLQRCNGALHHCNDALHHCNGTLHRCNVAPHHCSGTLQRCSVPTQRCRAVLQRCSVFPQRCTPAPQRCRTPAPHAVGSGLTDRDPRASVGALTPRNASSAVDAASMPTGASAAPAAAASTPAPITPTPSPPSAAARPATVTAAHCAARADLSGLQYGPPFLSRTSPSRGSDVERCTHAELEQARTTTSVETSPPATGVQVRAARCWPSCVGTL
jgi:hypothetical protein